MQILEELFDMSTLLVTPARFFSQCCYKIIGNNHGVFCSLMDVKNFKLQDSGEDEENQNKAKDTKLKKPKKKKNKRKKVSFLGIMVCLNLYQVFSSLMDVKNLNRRILMNLKKTKTGPKKQS